MRLIDADAMLKRNEHSIYDTTDLKEMLNDEPTAYDVDMVVEDLEGLKTVRSMKNYASTGIVHDYADIKDVINTIKGGGVDE